jgi:hypothetical protein
MRCDARLERKPLEQPLAEAVNGVDLGRPASEPGREPARASRTSSSSDRGGSIREPFAQIIGQDRRPVVTP